jgi:hypothetical protein
MKDRLLYSGSIVWKKDNRGKGVSLLIYILNTHRTWRCFGSNLFLMNFSDSDFEEAPFGSQEVLYFLSGNLPLIIHP